MMPSQIDTAIQEMCTDAMNQAVLVLSKKYGFDNDEAARLLSESGIRVVRKGSKSNKLEPSPSKTKTKTDKPKRGKTGYLLYADAMRAKVKADMESELDEGEKIKPQDVVKRIAAAWKEIGDEEKAKWQADAKALASSSDDDSVLSDKDEPNKVNDQPVNDQPVNDQPVNDQPANDEPVNDEPKKPKKDKKKKKKKQDDDDDSD